MREREIRGYIIACVSIERTLSNWSSRGLLSLTTWSKYLTIERMDCIYIVLELLFKCR